MRTLLVYLLVVAPWAQSAAAAGLDLAWGKCAGDGGVADVLFDCANPNLYDLMGSFSTDGDVPDVSRYEFQVDLQVDAATVPGFWDSSEPFGCHHIFSFIGAGRCPTASNLVNATGGGDFDLDFALLAPNRGRFVGVHWVFPTRPTTVVGGRVYWALWLPYSTLTAIEMEGGSCAGCPTPVVFVFNRLTLIRASGPPVDITGPGMFSNCATAGGGGTVPCGATPATHKTWGALKTLYR